MEIAEASHLIGSVLSCIFVRRRNLMATLSSKNLANRDQLGDMQS